MTTVPTTAANGRFPLPDGISVYYFFEAPNTYHVPSVQFWNAAIQRQLTSTISIDAAYVGNVGRHIFVNANVNQAVPGPGDQDAHKRFANFGLTQGIYSTCNCDSSNYNGLQLKFEQKNAHGLDLMVNYTYAKALDSTELGGVADNNLDYHADYGPASFNRKHSLVIANVWKLPFGRGQRFGANLNKVEDLALGGWEFNGISTLYSGTPFGVNVADAPLLNANFNGVRPDRIGNPKVAHPSRDLWFNPAAYTAPRDPYRDGNESRDSLVGPREFLMNLSLAKVFTITEGKTLQFRWENFNALNHVNLNVPQYYVDVTDAGKITSLSANMRQMQFGLHLRF